MCGGEACDGVLTKVQSSWQKTFESEQEILNAMEEVDKLAKMVQP